MAPTMSMMPSNTRNALKISVKLMLPIRSDMYFGCKITKKAVNGQGGRDEGLGMRDVELIFLCNAIICYLCDWI